MAEISAKLVMTLREKTNAGMMECKKALTEAEGDLEKAETILRKSGTIKAEKKAEELAKEEGVDLRFHDIIYKVSEEIEQAMIGKLDSLDREVYQGRAEVLQIFKAGKTVIAGSRVTDGFIKKNGKVRVKRGEDQIFEGLISALKRFKDDVNEVKNGFECGISLQGFDDLREGDILEFHTTEKYAQTSL